MRKGIIASLNLYSMSCRFIQSLIFFCIYKFCLYRRAVILVICIVETTINFLET